MALGPKWILDYHIKKHFHFHLFLLSFSKPIPFYLVVVLNVDFLYSLIRKNNMWGILYYLFPLLVDHLMLYLHVFINLLCGNMFLHNCLSSSITHIIMPQTIYIGSIYFLRQFSTFFTSMFWYFTYLGLCIKIHIGSLINRYSINSYLYCKTLTEE